MNLAPRSLRNRLVLGAAAVGLAFAVLFGIVATWRVNHAEKQAVQAALQSRVELARDEVAADGSINQDAGSPKTDLVQVIGPDGTIRASSPALAAAPALIDVSAVQSSSTGVEGRRALQRPDIDLAVLAVPLTLTAEAGSPAGTGALVVAVDAEGFNAATDELLGLLIAGLSAVVLAMAALSWIFTGRALHSVTRITEDAETVRPQDLASGLPVPHRDAELARLVEALNRMLGRLHESHATELAFAADAGHRLRTPVATLRAEAELALRETDPAELTAALQRIVHDADQLTSIVDRMLARSRAHDRGPEPVLDVLTAAEGRWQRQAELSRVNLSVRTDGGITPTTRCAELVEIVEPILDNAVRHTPAGGAVDIDLQIDGRPVTSLVVCVSNTGEPIPADIAPHLFDAWVSSRDATVAGGLGLWLARETARDLGGDVTVVHDGPHTTTFRVRLPIITDN
ncbi:MAG: HAMP domain-containing protein [Nocardioidaceae bacterium]|nr:HAMP domain-containing protein [Nocardioidaceae bacterium]